MEPTFSQAPSASTRAITIPLHGGANTTPRRLGHQNSRQHGASGRRLSKSERADSESGHASSLESDWTSSPASAPQSAERSPLGLQQPTASPATVNHMASGDDSPLAQHQRKDKQRATSSNLPPNTLPPLFTSSPSPLGPSMLSSSAYKSVNLNSHNDPESREPARLITYTKYSQGFTWNDELFLPSYMLGRHRYRGHSSSTGRRRWGDDEDEDEMGEFEEEGERCPVTDIFVTDEEAAAMMP